jgi:uncharacterized membrane protein
MTRKDEAATGTWVRVCMLGILLIAIALRAYHLGYQEISGDEAFSYFFSLPAPREIIQATIELGERNPPGGFLILKAWMDLAGRSEFALRFVGLWFGVLAVALLYRLCRQLALPVPTSMLAAGLLALSPFAVAYSQSPRAYSASLALGIASTVLAVQVLKQKRPSTWLGYVVVSSLGLYNHYTFILVLLAQNALALAGALLVPRWRQGLGRWFLCQAALVFLYSPWLIAARGTLLGSGQGVAPPGLLAAVSKVLGVFAVGETLPLGNSIVLVCLAGALLVVGGIRLALAGPSMRPALILSLLCLAFALGATRLSAVNHPKLDVRYFITALPAFYLLLAVAALGSKGRIALRSGRGRWSWMGAVVLTALLLPALISLGHYHGDAVFSKSRGWRELAATLERLSGDLTAERVRLIQNVPDPALWYYYPGPVAHLVLPPAATDVAGADNAVAELAASGVQRVILSAQQADWWDGNGIAQAALSRHYVPMAAFPVGPAVIHVYERPPTSLSPIGVAFANGVTLAAAAPDSRQLVPGGLLVVHLRWLGRQEDLSNTGKITLQILDSAGSLVAQTDQPFEAPESGTRTTSYGILVPGELPRGTYRLSVAVYDPGRPGSPRWLTTTGVDHTDLGELYVQ